jgi:hypothetical protein
MDSIQSISNRWLFDEPSSFVHDRILHHLSHPIVHFLKTINRQARGQESLCVLAGSSLANLLLGDCRVGDTFHIYSCKEVEGNDLSGVLQETGWFTTEVSRYRMGDEHLLHFHYAHINSLSTLNVWKVESSIFGVIDRLETDLAKFTYNGYEIGCRDRSQYSNLLLRTVPITNPEAKSVSSVLEKLAKLRKSSFHVPFPTEVRTRLFDTVDHYDLQRLLQILDYQKRGFDFTIRGGRAKQPFRFLHDMEPETAAWFLVLLGPTSQEPAWIHHIRGLTQVEN